MTLPLISPSTRRPPEKVRLPSILVPAPIRLSMRFCGLFAFLRNMDYPLKVLTKRGDIPRGDFPLSRQAGPRKGDRDLRGASPRAPLNQRLSRGPCDSL